MTGDDDAWGIRSSASSTCQLSGRWLLISLLAVWGLQQVRAQDPPTVTLLFNSSSATVVEGTAFNVQLIAQGTYDVPIEVPIIFEDDTAMQFFDYSPLPIGGPHSVHFEAGAVSSSLLTVVAVPNNAFDPVRRRFRVRFVLPDVTGLTLSAGRPQRLSVTIVDDDSVRVSFEAPCLEIEEDIGFVDIRLQAEGLYSRPFEISFICVEVVPVEAENGVDFKGGVYSVVFDTTGTLETVSTVARISVFDDNVSEASESFICVILRPDGMDGIVVDDPNTIKCSILDDDLTLLFNSSSATVVEGTTVLVQLIAQGTYDIPFDVPITFEDDTAMRFLDYAPLPLEGPHFVHFEAGAVSSSLLTVVAVGNNAFDPVRRRFRVRFVLPNVTGLTLNAGRPQRLSVTIVDDDSVKMSFDTPSREVNESIGSIDVQLQAEGLYSRPFEVSFICVEVVPVEAEDGVDFTGDVYTVEFDSTGRPESESSVASIRIFDDEISEATESFICVILRPHGLDGIVVDDPSTIHFAILDDDLLEVKFERERYTTTEGGNVSNIRLVSTECSQPFQVQVFVFTLDADSPFKEYEALINVDYVDPLSRTGAGVVTFNPTLGLLSTPLTITTIEDNIVESTEYLGLRFVGVVDVDDLNPITIIPVEPTQAVIAIEDNDELFVRVRQAGIGVDEDVGSVNVTFEVVREESPGSGTFVPAEVSFSFDLSVSTVDGTAVAPEDFADRTGTVTFTAGDPVSSLFTVMINDDDIIEGTQAFDVSFTVDADTVRDGADVKTLGRVTTVTIRDNDEMFVRWKDVPPYEFNEGDDPASMSLEVVREVSPGVYVPAEFSFNFDVDISTSDGSAVGGDDFTSTTSTVSFTAGDSESSAFNVPIREDVIIEGTEIFMAEFTVDQATVPDGADVESLERTTTVTINDNDEMFVRCRVKQSEVGEGDGSVELQLEVVREEPLGSGTYVAADFSFDFDVDISTATDTAVADVDFDSTDAVVKFTAGGSVSSTFTVTITDDNIAEGTEMFIARFTIVGGSVAGGAEVDSLDTECRVIIEDNDPIFVRPLQTNVDVDEDGVSTELRFEVVRETFPGSGVYVPADVAFNFTISVSTIGGTATLGADFDDTSGTVTFTAGNSTSSVFSVLINDDTVSEGPEDFTVRLTIDDSSVANGADVIVLEGDTTVLINDNDLTFITFPDAAQTVVESVGIISLILEADNVFERRQSLNVLSNDGTTQGSEDYELVDTKIIFEPNSRTSLPFRVLIVDNVIFEETENFILSFAIPAAATLSGSRVGDTPTHTVTILDDDKIFVRFEQDTYLIGEGDVLRVRLVLVNGTVYRPVDIKKFIVEGTATNLEDAVIVDDTRTTTFSIGSDESSYVDVLIVEDMVLEGDETFTIRPELDAATAEYVEILLPNPEVTIVDNDEMKCALSSAQMPVTEGPNTEVEVTVECDIQAAFPFSVTLNVNDGTAANGEDYSASSTITVNFPPGTQSQTVAIPIIDDDVAEPIERFTVGLEVPDEFIARDITAEGILTTTVIIMDDDCVTVTISTDQSSVEENSNLPLTVTVVGDFSQPFEVTITTQDGTATGGDDFNNAPLSVRFEPDGPKSQERDLVILNDILNEGDETFKVILVEATTTTMCYNIVDDTLDMTIGDDDDITIFFIQPTYSVEEGNDLTVTLEISGDIQYPFTVEVVPCSRLNGPKPATAITGSPTEATIDEDYSGSPVAVTFVAGMKVSSDAIIVIVDDDLLEGPEVFELCIQLDETEENRQIALGDPDTSVITITDNSPDDVCARFSAATYSADEDDMKIVVTIETDKQSFAKPFSVVLTITDIDANEGDLPTLEYTVEIPAGAASIDQNITVNLDYVLEDDEDFRITLTTAPSDLNVSPCPGQDVATLTVVNDDMEIVFVDPSVPAVERGGPAEFCLRRIGDTRKEVTVTVSTGQSAKAEKAMSGQDYSAVDNMDVTFSPGQAEACFQVNTRDDNILERPTNDCFDADRYEYADVSITSASVPQATKWDTSISELIIEDDDFELAFVNQSVTIEESSPEAKVCVYLCGYRSETVVGFIVIDHPATEPATVSPSNTLPPVSSGSASGMDRVLIDLGNDVVTTEIMLTFPTASTIQCGDLVIEDDDRVEDIEDFELFLEEVIPTPRAKRQTENRRPSNRTTSIPAEIVDDDVLEFTLTVTPMRSPEGTTVTALITATVEYEIDFLVLFNFTDETAVRRVDYNFDRTERRKRFTPTDNTHMISISYFDDDIVEGDHTYVVSMLVRDTTRPFVLPPAVQATIEDTDELCISFMPAAYMVDEGDTVSLTFMLQQLLEVPVRVDISFTDGSAVSPGDYTSDTQTIRIPAGGTMGMVDVPTIADTIIENSETFVAMFARVRGDGTDGVLNRGCSSSADVTIIDTTTAEVFFTPTMYSVPEGDSVTLTLMIDADVAPGVTRTFTINTQDGTATSADDYVAGPYTATFSGTNIATITIATSGNNVFENDETFTAVVEGGSTDSLIQPGTDDEATINIEESGELTVQFTMTEYRVLENNGLGVVFLETSGPHDVAFTVTVTVQPDTATAFEDYDALSADVIFNPGETTKPFNINILDDKILERDETIILMLFVTKEALGENVFTGAITMTTLVIEDDEEIVISFSEPTYSALELTEMISVTVLISSDHESIDPFFSDVTVAVTDTGGTAMRGVDYEAVNYEFEPVPPSMEFNIVVIDEDVIELNETIDLAFVIPSELSGIIRVGAIPTAEAIIIDDSSKVVSFNVAADDLTVTEGETFSLPITIDYPAAGPFTVMVVVTGGTATGGVDYVSGPYTVTFPPRSKTTNLEIPTHEDIFFEGSENVMISVELSSAQGSFVTVENGDLTLTILDNEAATIAFSEDMYTVMEENGQVVIPIVATVTGGGSFQPGFVVEATVNTVDGTATANEDFTPGPYNMSITFNPTTLTHELTIDIVDDDRTEFTQEFMVVLVSNTPKVSVVTPSTATVVIDDPPEGRICTFASPTVVSPFYSDPNPAEYNVENSCDYQLVTVCDGSYDFTLDVDISGAEPVGLAASINGTVTNIQGAVNIPSLGISILYDNDNKMITVEIIATSPIYSSLCGLCGTSNGDLVDKMGNMIPLGDREEVNRVVETYRLPPEQSLFLPARPECAVLRNDSVTSDPLITIPILIPGNTNPDLENPSLCIELHGSAGQYFNYLSDTCVSMNTGYHAVDVATNVVNEMGMKVVGSGGTCHMLRVSLEGCAVWLDGNVVSSTVRDDGIIITRRADHGVVRIEAPNCGSTNLVVWAMCQMDETGLEFMKVVITRGINLQPTSHGIMGQFWNVPVEAEIYDGEYGSGSATDVYTYYTVTVKPPAESPERSFVAEYGSYVWSYVQTPCLYAGNRQAGPLREVRDGPNDSVIEGFYTDYVTSGIFDTDHKYNRFDNSRCT